MSKETIKQTITTIQEKANKVFEKAKQIGNTEVNSANIQKAVQSIRKTATENAKYAIVGGAAAMSFGAVDKIQSNLENQRVYLPAVVEALDKANAKGQGKEAAMDYLNRDIPTVSKQDYYRQVANKELPDSVIPPDTTKTIASKLEIKANENGATPDTAKVLFERSKQKITPDQAFSISESATRIEEFQNNRNIFDNSLILGGLIPSGLGLALRRRKPIEASRKVEIDSVIPSDQQKAEMDNVKNGDDTLLQNFSPEYVQFSTGNTLESNITNANEVKGIKDDLSAYLKLLNEIYHSKESIEDKVKIDYVYKFINTLKSKINSTEDLETVKNLKIAAKAVMKSLLKNPETLNLDAEGLYNYISSKKLKLTNKIPEEVFNEAQKNGLSAIYDLTV
jgi:hypothetical protein